MLFRVFTIFFTNSSLISSGSKDEIDVNKQLNLGSSGILGFLFFFFPQIAFLIWFSSDSFKTSLVFSRIFSRDFLFSISFSSLFSSIIQFSDNASIVDTKFLICIDGMIYLLDIVSKYVSSASV